MNAVTCMPVLHYSLLPILRIRVRGVLVSQCPIYIYDFACCQYSLLSINIRF